MKVINLFGAPSSGKSTTAAGLFFLMKREGINCELVTEYAKKLVWEERKLTFNDQLYITSKQNHELEVLNGKVDYAISDSPLMLGIIYARNYRGLSTYEPFVHQLFKSYNNLNFFINRVKPYSPIGRNQTEGESDIVAKEIRNLLIKYEIPFINFNGDDDAPSKIFKVIKRN